jgi:hypothetical protein
MKDVLSTPIHFYDSDNNVTIEQYDNGPYAPRWQTYPVLLNDRINCNAYMEPAYASFIKLAVEKGKATISNFVMAQPGNNTSSNRTTSTIATLHSINTQQQQDYDGSVFTRIFLPIYDTFDISKRQVVSILSCSFLWEHYFMNTVAPTSVGITAVLENTCSGYYTYQIDGAEVSPIGEGDLHDTLYNSYKKQTEFHLNSSIPDGTGDGIAFDVNGCIYKLSVYPSQVRN